MPRKQCPRGEANSQRRCRLESNSEGRVNRAHEAELDDHERGALRLGERVDARCAVKGLGTESGLAAEAVQTSLELVGTPKLRALIGTPIATSMTVADTIKHAVGLESARTSPSSLAPMTWPPFRTLAIQNSERNDEDIVELTCVSRIAGGDVRRQITARIPRLLRSSPDPSEPLPIRRVLSAVEVRGTFPDPVQSPRARC